MYKMVTDMATYLSSCFIKDLVFIIPTPRLPPLYLWTLADLVNGSLIRKNIWK